MRALVITLLIGAVAAAPGSGQDTRELDPLVRRIASLWAGGDASGIARHVAATGLELEVEGASMAPIHARKVAAALRRVFAGQETVSVVATMTARVQGAEDRAFGELAWEHRDRGAAFAEMTTVFVGLVREGPVWRVSQIRILPE